MISTSSSQPRPFVKWAGGKQSLVDSLIEFFPSEVECYYEPFVGGGSVFFSVEASNGVISDDNQWLIDTYQALRDDWSSVAAELDRMINTKAEFLRIRAIPPSSLLLPQRAAHFIYLNKTCFRGLFRVNRKGEFNVPYGDYDRRYYSPANLADVSAYLQQTEIRSGDFEFGVDGVKRGDFIYFDPPYYKLGGYSDFNRYTKNQFREKDHFRLAALCRELDDRSVRWALSNSDTPFIHELFSGFRFSEVRTRREINLNSKERTIKELLITNF